MGGKVSHQPHKLDKLGSIPRRRYGVHFRISNSNDKVGTVVALDNLTERQILSKLSYWMTGNWWYGSKKYPNGIPNITWGDTYATSQEMNVRGAGMVAVTLATTVKHGYANKANGGADLDLNLVKLRSKQLMVAMFRSHKLNRGSAGWGRSWQSSHWAYLMGFAHMLNPLDYEFDRERVKAVIVDEANYQLGHPVEYWKDLNGNYMPYIGYYPDYFKTGVRTGDSAFEEMLWCSNLLDFAAMTYPDHPNSDAWYQKAVDFAAIALSTADDAAAMGLPGFNVRYDYKIVNHGIVNAAYSEAAYMAQANKLHHRIYGDFANPIYDFNAENLYAAIQTMYVPNSPSVKPGMDDWGNRRPYTYLVYDASMKGTSWYNLRLKDIVAMQAKNTQFGKIVMNTTEDKYPACDAYAGQCISMALLFKLFS